MENLLDRFLRYVAVDTQSDENSESQPSTGKQLVLLEMLRDELRALGLEAELDQWGYVMATLPSNLDHKAPAIGFIAHVDTSPDASGKDVKAQIIRDYDGGDIELKGVPGLALRVADFPELAGYKGQTIITTDGTTLLGADDKAGVAEIMNAVEYLVEHPEVKHPEVKIGFTPDEEIGRGVIKFDVARFGADYAYTMDGGAIGELEFENFNAAAATVKIQGRNIHPGYAKGKMKNAMLIGMEFNSLLPVEQRPEYTEGYEGFYHLIGFKGSVEQAELSYILRDHDLGLYEKRKETMLRCAEFINAKWGEGTASVELRHQYYNMRKEVEPHYHIIEKAVKAMEMNGIKPKIQPIRGGTDGANLSFMGLPCPNIFAGGHNFHGKMEFVPLESMEAASRVILGILEQFAQ
ncbi:MAG: peptidase T [Candidatus Cryptobacteroides sp.]|nr:peptidase T [Candidatus Cryptobacteroides sp.]